MNEKMAIKQFNKAMRDMALAERALAKVYEPILKKACENNDLSAISDLIFRVPEKYRHKVRVYQAYMDVEKKTKQNQTTIEAAAKESNP